MRPQVLGQMREKGRKSRRVLSITSTGVRRAATSYHARMRPGETGGRACRQLDQVSVNPVGKTAIIDSIELGFSLGGS